MKQTVEEKKETVESSSKQAQVTFLTHQHFRVGDAQYHFRRGDVAQFTPEHLAHLIQGQDYVVGAIDLTAEPNKKK